MAGEETADPRSREFSRWLDEVEKIVFSRTLAEVDWTGARVTDGGSPLFEGGTAPSSWRLAASAPTGTGALRLTYDVAR